MLAIIGGDPKRFRPYVDLFHRAFAQLGKPVQPIGVHSPGYVADSDEQAREELWPDYKQMRDRIGAERGWPRWDDKNSIGKPMAAPSLWAPRKPSHGRLQPPRRRSAFRAST
jgi:hypothetical protein